MATTANAASLPETIAAAIGRGKSKKEVVNILTKSGVTPQDAQAMVDMAVRSYPSAVRSGALKQIGQGALLLIIGLVITGVTLGLAQSGATGGFFVLSWGPIIYGAARIIRGFFRLITA
jgi:hypothetical protein